MLKKAALITAAGSSRRMQGGGKKELRLLEGRTVLERAVLPFVLCENFDTIYVTHPPGGLEEVRRALGRVNFPFRFVEGGASRQLSVLNALRAMRDEGCDVVLIHDGARPYVSEELIGRVLEAAVQRGNCTPVIPSVSAMKVLNDAGDIEFHLLRENTVGAQTPQGFAFPEILEAHERALEEGAVCIDDSEVWSLYMGPAHTVSGEPENIKITYPGDLRGRGGAS